jgi:RNA polymerase nonessential primary-like sigma factor
VLRAQRELSQKLDHEPGADEIAELLERPVSEVRHLLRLSEQVNCTEASVLEPERDAWDSVEDQDSLGPAELLQNEQLSAQIEEWLNAAAGEIL